jgi:hypothetical protein
LGCAARIIVSRHLHHEPFLADEIIVIEMEFSKRIWHERGVHPMSIGYPPERKSGKTNIALIVVAIVGVFMALVIGGIIYLASLPDGGVKMSNEIEPYAIKYMETHHLLDNGEKLVAYYDATVTCNGSEAAILTNQNLKYHKNGTTTTFPIHRIRNITHISAGIEGDIIEAENIDGQFMKVEIAALNGGKNFYNALKRLWERSKENKQGNRVEVE